MTDGGALGAPSRRVGEVGRLLVPLDAPAAAAWTFDVLYPPHGLRGRVRRRAGAAAARWALRGGRRVAGWPFERVWRLAEAPARWTGALALAAAGAEARSAAREGGDGAAPAAGWTLVREGPGRDGRPTLLFRFAPGEGAPRDVVKLRPLDGGREALRREREALETLALRAPGRLADTVPTVLGHGRAESVERLRLSVLPGRSAYVEMLAGPREEGRIAAAFRSAGRWLAELHAATRAAGPWRPAWHELGEGPEPEWYRELAAALDAGPVRAATGHGDFWPRNVLLTGDGGERTSVVDWEACTAEPVPPLLDLFDFPLAYGLAYPWRRPGGPEDAFRRTFVEASIVSRAVRAYVRLYAAAAGWRADLPAALLRLYLRLRRRAPGPFAGRRPTGDPAFWSRCEEILAEAERCALSG